MKNLKKFLSVGVALCIILSLLPIQSQAVGNTIDVDIRDDITTIYSITYKITNESTNRKIMQLFLDCDYSCPADNFGGNYARLSPATYTYTEDFSDGNWGYTSITGSARTNLVALTTFDSSLEKVEVTILTGFLAYEDETNSTAGASVFYCHPYTYEIDLTIPCGTIDSAGTVTSATPYLVTGGNIYFDVDSRTILDCDKAVTQANVPETINGVPVEHIGASAFSSCDVTEIYLPNSVLSIGSSAFQNCTSLSKITLPVSIHEIKNSAFLNCNSLSDVYYLGNEEQWENISIGLANEPLESAQIHYNFIENKVNFSTDRWNFSNLSDQIPFDIYKTLYGPIKGLFLSMIDNGTNGHCYGMAATTAAINTGLPSVTTFNKSRLVDVNETDFNNFINMDAHKFIDCGHLLQYSTSISKQNKNTKNDLAGLYNAVKNFQNGDGAPVVISMRGDTTSKKNVGHTVYALRVHQEDSTSCKIVVNDSNVCSVACVLQLQKNANGEFVGWTYDTTGWGSNQPNGEISYSTPAELLYDVAVLYSKEAENIINENSLLLISNIDQFTIQSNDNTEYIGQDFNDSVWIYPIKPNNLSNKNSENEANSFYWIDTQNNITISNLSKASEISVVGKSVGITVSAPAKSILNLDVLDEKSESATIDLSSCSTTEPNHIRMRYTTTNNNALKTMEISGVATETIGTKNSKNGITVWGLSEFTVNANINGQTLTKHFSGLDDEKKQLITVQDTETGAQINSETLTEEVNVNGIAISQPNIRFVKAGETYQLSAKVLPIEATNKSISWTSSNPNVATVTDSGLVTAVSNGVTTITAKTQDGGYTATCEVTVEIPEAPNIPVTNVNLNTQRITLSQVGSSYQLKAEVTPTNATNQTVVWASSNPDIAMVNNNGLVTAVSEGSTTITATTQDGQKVATCFVTVHIESSSSGTSGGGSSSPATPTPHLITTGETDSGTIIISHKTASKGETVTITAVPDDGFMLETLSASDKNGNKIQLTKETDTNYTFKMPASQVKVSATFTEIVVEPELVALPFGDIPLSAWYYEAVKYVYSNHLMQGTAETTFSPDEEMSRAMIATVLYRLENTPVSTGNAFFSDVETNEWYTDAIRWAAQNNVITGYGNNRFGPMDSVTREQLAVILYNYTVSKGISAEAAGDLSAFSDAKATSDWAEEAMSWAVGVGLLSGKGNATLDPTGTATRAEVAQMLMNYLTKII